MKTLSGLISMVVAVLVFVSTTDISITEPFRPHEPTGGASVSKIYWSDGDSGRLDGRPFRLANVDAPEKGGVGAIGGAKCEAERARAFRVKDKIVEMTRYADIRVSKSYGLDRYDREVVDLDVNGRDLASIGIREGHYRPWPHKGERALTRKPDWCSNQQLAMR